LKAVTGLLWDFLYDVVVGMALAEARLVCRFRNLLNITTSNRADHDLLGGYLLVTSVLFFHQRLQNYFREHRYNLAQTFGPWSDSSNFLSST
jgi:hypothetical protein